MSGILQTDIKFLSGVGPKRAEILARELNIFTYADLIYYFPFRHIDRSKFYAINEVHADLPYIQLKGKIVSFQKIPLSKNKSRLVAQFTDGSGTIEIVWFSGVKWIESSVKANVPYVVFGKPNVFGKKINLVHPEIEPLGEQSQEVNLTLQPVYSITEKLKNSYITSKTIHKLQKTALLQIKDKIAETLPDDLRAKLKLMGLNQALQQIHFPLNSDILQKAQYRLKFEELFYLQLNILKMRYNRQKKFKGFVFETVGELFHQFYKENLPFELTGAQKKVIKEIRQDMGSGQQMNRLLQGDVGSGKTLVALMTMIIALDNGFQACLMAPTEILARQHYNSLNKMLDGLPIRLELLTGSTKKSVRKELHADLLDGSVHILVGTHALLEDIVQFKNLGMVVIDEQHRFGVAQRAKLWKKNTTIPHVLVMTATPIPRTLAMTVYGDLEVSVIDELPPGRKEIQTVHYNDSLRLKVFGFMRKQIKEGRQIYIVYPLISESEKMDYKDLEDGYESIVRAFPPPEYQVSIVHGKMKPENKDFEMQRFIKGETQIMVATTVIEVGVDVPNASVMVIESAERFGLSQLHQLRGRVGRGGDQSYCILMTSYKLSKESKQRLETMVATTDGFEIAEVDLRMRGPGDMEGTQQSGIPFDLKIANFSKDSQILQYARNIAENILEKDPLLEKEEHKILKVVLNNIQKSKINFSVVS